MTTKITTDNIASETLTTILGPKVSSIVYPGDDTAANTAGGDSITLLGSGFNNGASVIVNGTSAGVVTVVSSTQITFTAPAQTAGTYVIYVINSDGGTAISIPGISYSGTPTWSTTAGNIGVGYETGSISTTVTATGDAPITYSVVSGTLPTGSTLDASSGLISGTAQATASSTTYSFTIKATDAQNQDTNRAFSITVNPDVVTWSSPANSTTYEVFKDIAIANVAMSATSASGGSITYTADTLPTGVSITGANIAGTPTVAASTTTTLTATSTTTRTATRTINWVVSIANDTFFKNVTLLLNGETTVTPFISDASTNSLALTIQGDTKPVLFNPYTPGYYSNYFDGTGDYLSAPANAAFAFGTGDYTLEFWVYSSIAWASTICLYNNNNGGYFLQYATGTGLQTGVAGSSATGTYAVTLTSNNWNHIAVSRASGSSKCFVNGTQVGTTVTDNTNYAQNGAYIGALYNGSQPLTGYISNLRVVKGTAVYTSAFTPSTTPLTAIANTSLLTCQSNRLIDNSTNAFAITKSGDVTVSPATPFTPNSSYSTYGSAYFNGTDSYMQAPLTPYNFAPAGDFTIEAWVYLTGALASGNYTIASNWPSGAVSLQAFQFQVNTSGRLLFMFSTGGTQVSVTGTSTLVSVNAWNHVAVSRSGATVRLFVNGVQDSTTGNNAGALNVQDPSYKLAIGCRNDSGGYYFGWNGYITDFRFVGGTAVYTANFTPPTTPLTAVANTSLLTLQYNGGANNSGIIDNSNFNNIITRVGNTSQGTFSPYSVSGWSFSAVNPAADSEIYVSTYVPPAASSFTYECWVYPTAFSDYRSICRSYSGATIDFEFFCNSSGQLLMRNGSGTALATTTTTLTLGIWAHVALVRNGTALTIYINGVSSATATFSTSITNTRLDIGCRAWNGDYVWSGNISNFRYSLAAVYTTAFTPSTTPLTASVTTQLLLNSNRFVDTSSSNSPITLAGGAFAIQAFSPFGSVPEAVPISYSNYFDGTGDYLQTPTAVFGLGTIFTVEAWVYPTELVTGAIVFASTASGEFSLGYNSTTRFGVSARAVAWLIDSTTLPTLNAWNHIVVSRGGLGTNQTSLFINGVRVANSTVNNVFTTMSTWQVGYDNGGGGGLWKGNISNLRVVAGTDVYGYTNTTLTSPSAPLTAIANTSLLTCQSTRMIDNSTNNFTLTAAGDVKPRIFNPFGYTAQSATSYTPSLHGGSMYFDGSGDYLELANQPIPLSGAGDFTMELWCYPLISGSSYSIISNINDGQAGTVGMWNLSVSALGKCYWDVFVATNSSASWGGNLTTLRAQAWNHIALSRKNGKIAIYINGQPDPASGTGSTTFIGSSSAPIHIGKNLASNSLSNFKGYITDIRFVSGVALYSSNFYPAASPATPAGTVGANTYTSTLLLNGTSSGIIDQHGTNVIETVGNAQLSTVVKKYNNASMYFDGTGDSLKILDNPNINLGSGDFTLECWVYFNVVNAQMTIISKGWNSSSAYASYLIWMNSDATLRFLASSNGGAWDIASERQIGTMTASTWTHIAVTRSGTSFRAFINGTIVDAFTFTSSASLANIAAQTLFIGDRTNGGTSLNGYIDDLRITKGYARYTSNFTAPTSAFITK